MKSLSGVEATRRGCFQFADRKRLSSKSGLQVLRQYLPHLAYGVGM